MERKHLNDAAHHRTFGQPPSPSALKAYLDRNFPDVTVTCAYEATKIGYWIYRALISYGYQCPVVNAADVPWSNKESSSKTDPVDSRKISKALRAGKLSTRTVTRAKTGKLSPRELLS